MSDGINLPIESEHLIKRIEELIQRRSSTDRRMGYVWMVVPILPILVGIVLVVSLVRIVVSSITRIGNVQQPQSAIPLIAEIFALYGFAIISFYIILLIGSFALYYLIDRRNAHFKRQQQLFATLPKYLSSRTTGPTGESIIRLSQISEDSIFDEQERPAGLWAILYVFVTPIVALLAAYDLTQDLRKHEERQSNYQATIAGAFNEADLSITPFASFKAHKRDPLLFLILTLITAGLFWIYWFYTLLKDYNEHFQQQAFFEDQVLAPLKPGPPTKACATCGGTVPEGASFCPSCGRPQSS